MQKWTRLDLRRKEYQPPVGTLVALRIAPKDRHAALAYKEGYDVGTFETDHDGKKLWFHHHCGVSDPVRMKKQCDIWWALMPEFDGV
jgi:hypothetical protein